MFKYCSLYSGSSGNCLFIQSNKTKLLIDAGVSLKKISDALNKINISGESINAVLVTHDHIDHTKGLTLLSNQYNIPIYANKETWDILLKTNKKLENCNINFFKNNKSFELNDLKISPFSTPHDAVNPCGFNIFKDNKKISIATDLGHVNDDIIKSLKNSVFVMLEANYDSEILKYSSYPYKLKTRISGPNGHLENCVAGQTISRLVHNGLEKALLKHLRKEYNFPALAYITVSQELLKANIQENDLNLNVAPRDYPSNIFNIS